MAGADQSSSCASCRPASASSAKHLRRHVLAHRLLIVGGGRPKEEHAVRRHLAHGLGAFALREHDALELRVILGRDALAAQMPAQHRHQARRRRAHHVLLIEPGELVHVERPRPTC